MRKNPHVSERISLSDLPWETTLEEEVRIWW